jgi:hypothetical protein
MHFILRIFSLWSEMISIVHFYSTDKKSKNFRRHPLPKGDEIQSEEKDEKEFFVPFQSSADEFPT